MSFMKKAAVSVAAAGLVIAPVANAASRPAVTSLKAASASVEQARATTPVAHEEGVLPFFLIFLISLVGAAAAAAAIAKVIEKDKSPA